MKNDRFADIAAGGIGGRAEFLYTPEPETHEIRECRLTNGDYIPVKTDSKISTKEQLYTELENLKVKYKPFLENHAPEINVLKDIEEIKNLNFVDSDLSIYEDVKKYILNL